MNAKTYRGKATPLHSAAWHGLKEMVELLIAKGADVNAKNVAGWTSLHNAIAAGQEEVVDLLIAAGTDVNAKDRHGKTPLDEAINPFYNKTEIANLIRKHGGKHGTIHSAVGGGDVEAAKEFLAAGADVNVKDKRGFTSLHWASISGHKEAVELLITKGADVNAMRGGGGTPLSYASSWGHEEIVELLIAKGADVNVKDAFSETPLDVSTHPDNPNASAETATLLRKHGGKTKKELEAAGK